AAGTALRLCQLRLRPLDVLPVVGDGALQHGGGGLLLLDLLLQNGGLCPDTLSLHVLLPHPLAVPLPLGIEGVQSG
ncbi:Aldolase, partial [Dysosmobacter welbionis]